jgi:transcriptional regulator with XRE-family HTH domain
VVDALKADGLTQAEIGALLSVAQNTVSEWLSDMPNIGSDNRHILDSRQKIGTVLSVDQSTVSDWLEDVPNIGSDNRHTRDNRQKIGKDAAGVKTF